MLGFKVRNVIAAERLLSRWHENTRISQPSPKSSKGGCIETKESRSWMEHD
jgi:hypothetical protein